MVRDGALHAVNFDALPVGKSGFLAEDAPLIHSLASERDLVGMRRGDRIGRGILAVGGVSYDRVASGRPAPVDRGGSRDGSRALSSYDPPELRGSVLDCGDFGKIRFPALPASALEVKDIAALAPDQVDAALPLLDAALRDRYAEAYKYGAKLRFIARLRAGGTATVGLEALAADHPLAGGAGTDNRVAIWSDRYPEQPLVIQGPGAGAGVTAAALLDDALRIARDA